MARRAPSQQTTDNSRPRSLSLDDASTLAARWEAEYEDYKHEAAIQAHFRDEPPGKLLEMWEAGRNERGRKLSRFEAEALACAICNAFGALPSAKRVEREHKPPPEKIPPDDTKLSAKDVCRLIGVSPSTLKRLVARGDFPQPMRPTERRIAWPASDVRLFVEQMEERRNKPGR